MRFWSEKSALNTEEINDWKYTTCGFCILYKKKYFPSFLKEKMFVLWGL